MTYRRRLMLILAASALCQATLADGPNDNDTGIVISAGIGVSSIEDEDAPGDTFDGSGTAINVDIEWRFLRNLSVGMTVGTLGEDTDDFNGAETTIEVDTFGFFLRGLLPVGERVTLHARYGLTSYSVDIDPGFNSIFPFSDDADDFGIGIDYAFSDSAAIRLETRILDGDNQESGGLTTIGLRWQF